MCKNISETIKEIRKIHGLTQDNLAELIGMSSGHIGMLEQGRAKPSYDTISRLISKFDLDANIFFESSKNNKEIVATEIFKLLDELPDSQSRILAQLLRASVQIVTISDNYEDSDM